MRLGYAGPFPKWIILMQPCEAEKTVLAHTRLGPAPPCHSRSKCVSSHPVAPALGLYSQTFQGLHIHIWWTFCKGCISTLMGSFKSLVIWWHDFCTNIKNTHDNLRNFLCGLGKLMRPKSIWECDLKLICYTWWHESGNHVINFINNLSVFWLIIKWS